MLKNLDGLGEQAINKITEIALASQMKQVEQLSVNVKIDPQQLSKGIVDSLVMEGIGLVTPSNLRTERISLYIEDISVYPFKALMGNIKLSKPATGSAVITLKAQDISETLVNLLESQIEDEFSFKQINCSLESPNTIALNIIVYNAGEDCLTSLKLSIIIAYDIEKKAIISQSVNYDCSETFQEILGIRFQEKLMDILNFQFPIFDGIAFRIKDFKISGDELQLMAIAEISKFPKAK